MTRTPWFDDNTKLPLLDAKVQALQSFANALADGKVDKHELEVQQDRLIAAMRAVESELGDALHAKVTAVLVELSAYDIMRTLHELQVERLRGRFK
jgi:hypothetical protein